MNNNIIMWRRVFGIAAIQGALTLTWVIYNLYFPQLLVELGLNIGVAKIVLIVEHFLETIIEPIFGEFSDRLQTKIGTKLPVISWGIILASVFFILIPVLVILIKPEGKLTYLLPIIAIFWASCMAIFRSPVISLIGQTAPMDKLPQAMSILSLIGGVIGAFRFDVYGIILKLGSHWAFFIGSITLLITGFYLRYLYPSNQSINTKIDKLPPIKLSLLALIMTMGISISFGLRFIIPTVNNFFTTQLGENQAKLAMMLFFITLAVLSLLTGKIATKFGNYNSILSCLLIMIIVLQLLIFTSSWLIIALLCISLSLVLNSIIPFVIALVPSTRVGLGVGCYFGGFGAGLSFFDLIFPNIELNQGIFGSAIALLCAIIFLNLSQKLTSRPIV